MSDVAPQEASESLHLKKALGPVMLWGLGVGYVISGEYFGWNYGLREGGTYGLLVAFVLMTVMYVAFVFSYAEMACAMPRAGGVFVFGVRGLGMTAGYVAGMAQLVEFVFAAPAIAKAIGTYAHPYVALVLPQASPLMIAGAAYVVFTALNIWGVQQAAAFELAVTLIAVAGLILFTCVTAPHFEIAHFTANAWPHGWAGALAAIPFAIWFYLAIEGVANAAEESRHPRRDVPLGFGAAIVTLVVLATLVLVFAVGTGGWERVVYPGEYLSTNSEGRVVVAPGATPSDGPLPLALTEIFAASHPVYRIVVAVGLLGFIASFNGIVLIAGRALFEMGRVGFLPYSIGRTSRATRTPVNALLLNLVIGLVALAFLDTDALITMSALGAVTLYIMSMVALIRLRRLEPELAGPYHTPLYPWPPITALVLATLALATMVYFNLPNPAAANVFQRWIAGWYALLLVIALAYYGLIVKRRLTPDDIAHFRRID